MKGKNALLKKMKFTCKKYETLLLFYILNTFRMNADTYVMNAIKMNTVMHQCEA